MIHNRRLATANIGVAVGAFGIATFMALMQSPTSQGARRRCTTCR
jgi:hypothetical protein